MKYQLGLHMSAFISIGSGSLGADGAEAPQTQLQLCHRYAVPPQCHTQHPCRVLLRCVQHHHTMNLLWLCRREGVEGVRWCTLHRVLYHPQPPQIIFPPDACVDVTFGSLQSRSITSMEF